MSRGRHVKRKLFLMILTVLLVFPVMYAAVSAEADDDENLINLKDCKVQPIPDQTWAGTELELDEDSFVLTNDGDVVESQCYTLSYKNNVNRGTATVIATGVEEEGFTGTIKATFKIVARSGNMTVSKVSDQKFTGKALTPSVTVKWKSTTLKKGTDYTLKYSKNTDPGMAVITVTGKGNYAGVTTQTFKIIADISKAKVTFPVTGAHSGYISPVPTIKIGSKTLVYEPIKKMNKNKIVGDFTCTWNAKKITQKDGGTGKCTVTLKGKYYKGSKTYTFKCVPQISLKKAEAKGIAKRGYDYTGKPIEPKVTIIVDGKTLTEGADYKISYAKNVDAGTGYIVLDSGTNAIYKDQGKIPFTINKASWDVDASDVRIYQDANRHKVDVIKSVDGKKKGYDYQVYYVDEEGTKTGKYTRRTDSDDVQIQPKNWGGIWVPAYTIGSYAIHVTKPADNNHKRLDKYYFLDIVPPKTTSITSVKNSAKGTLDVNWKNMKVISRVKKGKTSYYRGVYEVMYSTRKDFTNSSYRRYVGTAQTHNGYNITKLAGIKDEYLLKKGATVYVKVRFGVQNFLNKLEGTAWGDWSAVKTIKLTK